jgi:2-polyprenyl-3-methyl-5-hydroxy-6-metoxy-1,4-benzoquinol methylase
MGNLVKIKKRLNLLVKTLNSEDNIEPILTGKVVTMSYLTVALEPIFIKKNQKNLQKEILRKIDESILIFKSYVNLSKFRSTKYVYELNYKKDKIFYSMHKKLWQEIWPEYNKKEYDALIEYRGKRLDYNNIKKEFYNKDVIDFGCGNGSILLALMKRGAKSSYGIDFGKKNIQVAKKWSKIFNFDKNMKFKCLDILKFKSKKKYDFIICSAVLHHLKSHYHFEKAMKNISSICKNGSYLYFYVRGYGGTRSLIQEACVRCFNNIDANTIKKSLYNLNFTREKTTHLVDWFKAIYLQTKPSKLHKIFKKYGFISFKRLKGPHKNDLDINQIERDKNSKIKFGSGELRYLCQYKLD